MALLVITLMKMRKCVSNLPQWVRKGRFSFEENWKFNFATFFLSIWRICGGRHSEWDMKHAPFAASIVRGLISIGYTGLELLSRRRLPDLRFRWCWGFAFLIHYDHGASSSGITTRIQQLKRERWELSLQLPANRFRMRASFHFITNMQWRFPPAVTLPSNWKQNKLKARRYLSSTKKAFKQYLHSTLSISSALLMFSPFTSFNFWTQVNVLKYRVY